MNTTNPLWPDVFTSLTNRGSPFRIAIVCQQSGGNTMRILSSSMLYASARATGCVLPLRTVSETVAVFDSAVPSLAL